jgi:hypothetical protein
MAGHHHQGYNMKDNDKDNTNFEMNELLHRSLASQTQSHESEHSNYRHDDFGNDDHPTSSSSIPKPTIILQWPMDYFVSNIFENGEECSKEDNITDWNSPPIYDEYLDGDCELSCVEKL